MSATEALRVQLDNVLHEVQLLRVENSKLHAEEQLTDQPSVELMMEMEELRQRLLESEERVIIAEQDADKWKAISKRPGDS